MGTKQPIKSKCWETDDPNCLLHQIVDGVCLPAEDSDIVCSLCNASLAYLESDSSRFGNALAKGMQSQDVSVEKADLRAIQIARQAADDANLSESRLSHISQIRAASEHEYSGRQHSVTPGSRLGAYQIIREIGRGGMGIVFEAQHVFLKRRVALKILPDAIANPTGRQRFLREVKAASTLHHSSIVPVFEVGEENGIPFYVMQLIDDVGLDAARISTDRRNGVRGDSQTDRRKRDHSSVTDLTGPLFIAEIGRQAAGALAFAHANGIIHRDIKPSNLLLDQDGHLWLADFGLAKHTDDDLTATNDAPGTLRYMAPERFKGICNERNDVYSLGVTLYELLAGKPVFEATDSFSLMKQVCDESPMPLRQIDSSIPRDLETIVKKAMQKEQRCRYATAKDFEDDLTRFLQNRPILARRLNSIERLWLWSRRNPVTASLTSILFLVLVAGSLFSTIAAFHFKKMADHQIFLTGEVDHARLESQRNHYTAEMNLAAFDIQRSGAVVRVKEYVQRWHPENSGDDLRGWEWHFLSSVTNHPEIVARFDVNEKRSIMSIEFSPDGKLFAYTYGSQIAVADAITLKTLAVLDGHERPVLAIRFSHCGSMLATGSQDRTLRIYDIRSQEALHIVRSSRAVGAVAWLDDDRGVLFNDTFHSHVALHYYDLQSRNTVRLIKNSAGKKSFRLSADQKMAVSLGGKRGTGIWDFQTRKFVADCELPYLFRDSVAWHPSRSIVVGSAGNRVILWDVEERRHETIISADEMFPSVAWDSTGNYLAAGSWDNCIYIWNLETKKIHDVLRGHTFRLQSLVWHPSKPLLASVDEHGTILYWNFEKESAMQSMQVAANQTRDRKNVGWNGDGQYLVASNGRDSWVWDSWSKQVRWPVEKITNSSLPMWSSSENQLMTGTLENTKLWQVQAKDGCDRLVPSECTAFEMNLSASLDLRSISWWHDGKELLYYHHHEDGTYHLWRRHHVNGKLKGWAGPFYRAQSVHFSADRSLAAVRNHGQTKLDIVDVATGEVVKKLQSSGRVLCVTWTDQYLVSADDSKQISVWNSNDWQRVKQLSGNSSDVLDIAWNSRMQRLASAGKDGTICIWNLADSRMVMVLTHNSPVQSLAWSPNGNQLASISSDGNVKVWDAGVLPSKMITLSIETAVSGSAQHATE